VKPDADGQIRISGVEPGEYDLALHIYGSTEGGLAHPMGVAVVRVTVPEGQSAVDLGTINVPVLPGLKVGDIAPAFEFTATDGGRQTLADARGKYVLIGFRATWCGRCAQRISEVESLREKYADRLDLVVIGANLDQDTRRAAEFLREKKLPWRHALLGDWSSTDVPARFAISSVPSYVLVGPDGHMLAHDVSLDAISALLETAASH
jgi:peroxiredoxin